MQFYYFHYSSLFSYSVTKQETYEISGSPICFHFYILHTLCISSSSWDTLVPLLILLTGIHISFSFFFGGGGFYSPGKLTPSWTDGLCISLFSTRRSIHIFDIILDAFDCYLSFSDFVKRCLVFHC